MIRLYDLNRRMADIEMIDGVMRIVSYEPGVEASLANIRRLWSKDGPRLTDQEFYELLPKRLVGQVRAIRV